MSLIVIAIASAHAIPPIIGAVATKSKSGMIGGVIIGSLIAFSTGNPTFVVSDLIGVGVGAWIGLNILENKLN